MSPLRRAILPSALALLAVLSVIGCDGPTQTLKSDRPEDKINPAMNAHQKDVRIKHAQDSGD